MIEGIFLISIGIMPLLLHHLNKHYQSPSRIQKEIIKEFNKEWEQLTMTKRFYRNRGTIWENDKSLSLGEVEEKLNKMYEENQGMHKKIMNLNKELRSLTLFFYLSDGNVKKTFKENVNWLLEKME